MSVVDDVHARLTAALGPDVPVLKPEQMGNPIKGNKPGQDGGLTAYLRAHPLGYVQIEEPLSITDDGTVGTIWLTAAAIAPSALQADKLALLVRRTLAGTSREPGRYMAVTALVGNSLSAGIYQARITYDILTVDGALTV